MCTTESTTCIAATETPTCTNTIKIVTHIFDAETVTYISAAETSNWIILTETITSMIATERSASITVTESTTCIVVIEPGNLHKLAIVSDSYIVPTETATCRIDCIYKLSLAEMVAFRDSFICIKEIEPISKHQVQNKIVLVLLV